MNGIHDPKHVLADLHAARMFLDMAIREAEQAVKAQPGEDDPPELFLRRAAQDLTDVGRIVGRYDDREVF